MSQVLAWRSFEYRLCVTYFLRSCNSHCWTILDAKLTLASFEFRYFLSHGNFDIVDDLKRSKFFLQILTSISSTKFYDIRYYEIIKSLMKPIIIITQFVHTILSALGIFENMLFKIVIWTTFPFINYTLKFLWFYPFKMQ